MGKQLKKLFFDKKLTDSGTGGVIAIWRANPWKICSVFIGIALFCTMIYGYFFSGDPTNFFGNLLFYIILIAIVIAGLYLIASTTIKFRKLIAGFLIAFIIIFVFYWVLGLVFSYTGLIKNWHYGGWTLIIILLALAGMGSSRINGELERGDVFYGFLVFIILCGINIPIANNMGFLANVDNLIGKILHLVPWKL